MKTFIILATGILLLVSCGENTLNKVSTLNIPDKYEQRVDSVLKLMTLDEKIGQLNQYTGNWPLFMVYGRFILFHWARLLVLILI